MCHDVAIEPPLGYHSGGNLKIYINLTGFILQANKMDPKIVFVFVKCCTWSTTVMGTVKIGSKGTHYLHL